MRFDDREDRIEFQGTVLVNAQQKGRCSWCGRSTVWHDIILREYLCSETCTVERHIEVADERLKHYGT